MGVDQSPEVPRAAVEDNSVQVRRRSPSDRLHLEVAMNSIKKAREAIFGKPKPLSEDEIKGVIDDAVKANYIDAEHGQLLREETLQGKDKT